jgi:peptidyl-prolyl cis-trans isomerase C
VTGRRFVHHRRMRYPEISMRDLAAPSARALPRLLAGGLLTLLPLSARLAAQPAPQGQAAPAATQPAQAAQAADPIVATVAGEPIHLSDVKAAAQGLPEGARAMPPQALYPMLLDQMIDSRVLVAEARKAGLDRDPQVKRQVEAAADRALQTAILQREVGPQITDATIRARYDRDVAGKQGAEEVHARHILVEDEATAKKIIADLKKGGDFAALSKQYSKDPGAAQQGGDLGFFKKDDMVAEFAAAAFALKDNELSTTPVKTQFGWHVIQVLGQRQAPPPSFEQARDDLRQQMIQEGVQKAVSRARAAVPVERFNLDGSSPRATDTAEPPPAK